MNRRTTLKNLMMASAGLVALPAWARGWSAPFGEWPGGSFLSPGEGVTLAAVADTILPAAEGAVGALEVGVPDFLARLFADCYEPEVQSNIKRQLNRLDTRAETAFSKEFSRSGQAEREGLLLAMAGSGDPGQEAFFDLVKGETIRGFLTSRKVLRDYDDYVVAPGHYYGCVDINYN